MNMIYMNFYKFIERMIISYYANIMLVKSIFFFFFANYCLLLTLFFFFFLRIYIHITHNLRYNRKTYCQIIKMSVLNQLKSPKVKQRSIACLIRLLRRIEYNQVIAKSNQHEVQHVRIRLTRLLRRIEQKSDDHGI